MHYLLFYEVVDNFMEKRTPFRAAHLEHLKKSFERGDLILAGALAEPSDGAVLAFRGHSLESVESFAKSDPYVVNGVIKKWRIRKWMTVIGDGASFI